MIDEVDDVTCNRCGYCCHFRVNGVITKCKHLIVLNGKTLCRIYNDPHRVGSIIHQSGNTIVRCMLRDSVPIAYPKCPYNKRIAIAAGAPLPKCSFSIPWIDKNLEDEPDV